MLTNTMASVLVFLPQLFTGTSTADTEAALVLGLPAHEGADAAGCSSAGHACVLG